MATGEHNSGQADHLRHVVTTGVEHYKRYLFWRDTVGEDSPEAKEARETYQAYRDSLGTSPEGSELDNKRLELDSPKHKEAEPVEPASEPNAQSLTPDDVSDKVQEALNKPEEE